LLIKGGGRLWLVKFLFLLIFFEILLCGRRLLGKLVESSKASFLIRAPVYCCRLAICIVEVGILYNQEECIVS